MSHMILKQKTALITGAASGIGRALAVGLARRGANVALADVNLAGLEETARMAIGAGPGVRITLHPLDVADRPAVAAFPAEIQSVHGGLDVLINNAGVAVGGTFEEVAEEDFDWLISINFFGVVRMTRAFLPLLHASRDARIVNVSSLYGLIAPPGQTAYVASKFAVRGFSESLRHELEGSRIGLTTVHPGGVATSIATSARRPKSVTQEEAARRARIFNALLKLPPEQAAETILRAIERRQPRIIVGQDAKIAATLERMLPVRYWNILRWLMRRSLKDAEQT